MMTRLSEEIQEEGLEVGYQGHSMRVRQLSDQELGRGRS